jgi:pyrroline-5-carboxylate reductase
MRVGIIGATGWLGSALTRALIADDLGPASDLVLLNRSGARPAELEHPGVIWATGVPDLGEQVDVVVVSVLPKDFLGLDLHAPGRLVVSFMAGVPMAALTSITGGRVVRAMPNAGAELGSSYTPWLAGADVTEADRAFVRALLARIGTEDEVTGEDQIDYLTGLSGSGAAYPALMAAAMLAHAQAAGLPEHVARRAVETVICGGADMLRGRIEEAPAMIETYRNYRGTTAAGLDAAEQGGFGAAIAAALQAASDKARAMWPPSVA